MRGRETPDSAVPTLGECHTFVPTTGITITVPAGGQDTLSLISARFSNMDQGRYGNSSMDPVLLSQSAWLEANLSATRLFAEHSTAMAELHRPGIEVVGNLELARVVNASIHALLGAYRADSPYSSAPEGLVSTRYSGHAFWDVTTPATHFALAYEPTMRVELIGHLKPCMTDIYIPN